MYSQYYPPVFGGAGIQARTLARCLVERGVDVDVLTPAVSGAERASREYGVHTRRLWPSASWPRVISRPAWGAQAGRILARREPPYDVVHVHGASTEAALFMGRARRSGARTLLKVTLLGSDDALTLRRHPAGRCFVRADRVVVMSTALRDACLSAGIEEDRVRLIPNGVPLDRFRPPDDDDGVSLRRRLGIPSDAVVGVSIGAPNEPRKRAEFLTRVWRRAWDGAPGAYLVLVGPNDGGPGHAQADCIRDLKSTIAELGLGEQVVLPGVVENPEDYLRAADVFLFASVQEGQPNAWLEAMATALPCVVSALPGVTDDFLQHGRNGFVIDRNDIDVFAHHVRMACQNPALAASLGRAAASAVRAHASMDVVGGAYLDLYEELNSRSDVAARRAGMSGTGASS